MTARFNPPPGWTPPDDWTPDPSWPPGPDGWALWIDPPPRSRWVLPALGVGALVVGLVLGAGTSRSQDSALADARTTITRLTESNDALEDDVDALTEDVAAAHAEIENMLAQTSTLEERATQLDQRASEIAALDAVLMQRQTELDTRQGQLDARAADLDARETAGSAQAGGSSGATASDTSVSYKNCDAAREAGAAPVRRGDPGYDPHLDRDNDGVGCE